ncbi:hypothetical protein [Cohaesibacter gelatinilyticus]|uniref:Uncharacterized protein n=1 Tax=Cohaesibacter gelatinilyticus TaxID=372072 RepID=A0A285PEF5_9HYPH|nr:hypothetical protein [Cohaesibacter gelatinilyticus]SNZ20095.1 hypothetical protein SAMN06265368_3194 [Cohaesibacter gelatinilyticus]
MPENLIEMAEEEGFKQGWSDCLAGAAKMPFPDIGFSLLEPGYVKHFNAAYYDAYETAREEQRRRAALEARRSHEQSEQRER